MRASIGGVGAVVALGVLAGCVGQPLTACPAVGYGRTLSVQLEGDDAAVDAVRVCDADELCSSGDFDGRMWAFHLVLGSTDEVTATAYRVDGSVAGEGTSTVEWRRVGGTAECGGPMEGGPVILPVS